MATHATDRIDSPEEKQRKVRLFVSDLIDASMGNLTLDKWMGQAIYEKILVDSANFVPAEDAVVRNRINEISSEFKDFDGAMYLRRNEALLIIKMSTREAVKYIRAVPDVQPDKAEALNFAHALQASGLACTTVSVAYIPVTSNFKSDLYTETYLVGVTDDPETLTRAQNFASSLVIATITQSSERDLQRMPGPSDLANTCNKCLARRIAPICGADFPQAASGFSLKAWAGTAAHQKLERRIPEIYTGTKQEITVTIAEIPGFGIIKGHIDMDLPEWSTMTDFKTTDLKKLALIQATSVPQSHFGQTMLYMYGLHRSGMPRSYATLAYIPRDSHKRSDIWVASCGYREDVAVGLLNRTRNLVERLRAGDVEDITSTGECFPCDIQPYLKG